MGAHQQHGHMSDLLIPARPSASLRSREPAGPATARRILLVAIVASAATLLVATGGLLVDQRVIAGAPAWLKPAKFGIAITAYLITLRWMIGYVRGRGRLLTVLAIVMSAVFAAETGWIDVQVLRNTTSHFNEATAGDAVAYYAAGGGISLVFVATIIVAVVLLRQRNWDRGIAAGVRWGLGICVLGMVEAISMTVNESGGDSSGGHTVGAADGGPGMFLTDWSLEHGDLRIAHFVGLHSLQALPVLAFLLARLTRLDEATRVRLLRIAGVGAGSLVLMLWWQAERAQALLRPDALTLTVAGGLALTCGMTVAAVLAYAGRRTDGVLQRR